MMAAILQTFDQYFVRVHEDNSWDEIYNPHEATVFNRKNEALKWARNETNMSDYITAISGKNVQKIRDEFDEWVKNGMVRRTFDPLNPLFNVMYDPEKHDALDVLKWHYEQTYKGNDLMIQGDVYSSWSRVMWDHFDFLHDFQAYHSHDFTEKYISFKIKVASKAKWKDFKKEMDFMLDNFEFNFFDGDTGGLIISIFDHDLSETRNMVLIMHDRENDVWSVDNLRFRIGTPVVDRKSLKECFQTIRKDYWYDDEDWDDEDDDLY